MANQPIPSLETLTQEFVRKFLHYNPDTGIWTHAIARRGVRAGQIISVKGRDGYLKIRLFRKNFAAHRLAWFYMHGVWPEENMYLDHINRIRDDNRFCNLRLAFGWQNNANSATRKDNTSGFKGVYWQPRMEKWRAHIMIHGKTTILGYFDNPKDAGAAYEAAARELFKEFANPT